MLAILFFIYCFYMGFTDKMPFGNIIFMAIPCAIVFWGGLQGLIGIAVVIDLVNACIGVDL